jgi:hypothetical protein
LFILNYLTFVAEKGGRLISLVQLIPLAAQPSKYTYSLKTKIIAFKNID